MNSSPLLSLETFYVVAGIGIVTAALRIALDTRRSSRWGSVGFWALLGIIFIFDRQLPSFVVGVAVIAMVALAATGQVFAPPAEAVSREERRAEASRLGNRLFWPALLVPVTAVVGSRVLPMIRIGRWALADEKQTALVALAVGAIIATVVGVKMIGARPSTPVRDGSRLLETIGWALLLPQLLAALGGIFQRAGVGAVVADLVGRALPVQYALVAVVAYCAGMAAFTMCLGNAFAAFAVITGGIGVPLIVQQHHGNPAIMAAIGMLSGYCGTLMTPMAANFNMVPAMLLELPDKNAVIRAQLPIALPLLAANIVLMYLLVYRF